MKTQHDEKIQEQVAQSAQAPRVIELGRTRAQLKETERHLLRERRITAKMCRYLNGDEIAEILIDLI